VAYRKILEGQTTVEGRVTLEWDLKDAKGKNVAPGLYYLSVVPDGEERQVRSVVVCR
jgi:flagellar hook assembly protein FlgD